LSLRAITLPNLRLLTPLKDLEILELKLGGTRDLRDLPQIGRLRYFETFLVRGLSDLGPVTDLPSLEYLFLQAQRQVISLPSFERTGALRRVHLQTMRGLRDLAPLARAPALETLVASDMAHLLPEHFRPFVGHPTLREAAVGLGSKKKNHAIHALLGLPAPSGAPAWIDLS
jgi:internalin A